MKESHKKLCVSMPQIQTPTESLQEAIVKDFPYEPKQQSSQPKGVPHTESTEHSFTASESQPKLLSSPKFSDYPEEEMVLRECDICGRKLKEERLQRHERACETQLRGQWKHDQMIKRAQAKQLANLQFHDFEKRYKTHKWKKQHAELEELFALSKDALDKSMSKEFELIHLDFIECNTCHRMFHPKRINLHSEHCQKTHQKLKEKKPLYSPRTEGKVHTLSKGMQRSEKESLKSVTQSAKKDEMKKTPRTPQFKNSKAFQDVLMPEKPDFVKIKLKEVHEKVEIMNEKENAAPVENVKPKALTHIKSNKTAGPLFANKTATAFLKTSDYANKK
jgi:hypothetical protein